MIRMTTSNSTKVNALRGSAGRRMGGSFVGVADYLLVPPTTSKAVAAASACVNVASKLFKGTP